MVGRQLFDDFQNRVIPIRLENNNSLKLRSEMGNRGADIIQMMQYTSYHRDRLALLRRYVINAAEVESNG